MTEEVVLVDDSNKVIGTMPKSEVHGINTPLHRGFSLFLFDKTGKLMLQQRSKFKKTWPLIWSNSVCGHPKLGESNVEAARRRLSYELGIHSAEIEEAAPYRYSFVRDGIMENEICPILIGTTTETPMPNREEVEDIRLVSWPEFLLEIAAKPGSYSEWCEEEAKILSGNKRLAEILNGRK